MTSQKIFPFILFSVVNDPRINKWYNSMVEVVGESMEEQQG
jgi:hypothetical protein